MLRRLWARLRRSPSRAAQHCTACPLAECERGCRAAVLRMECAGEEAHRLRNLGLYEGSCVTIVDRQDGYLLDVRGSRLALGSQLAHSITVLPLRS
jgi:Fe2+ transport system protein FeoA